MTIKRSWGLAMERLDAVRDGVLETLDGFKQAAPAKIKVTPNVPELLENLRAALTSASKEELETSMYDMIAEPYSMIIGYDIEGFHEQELRETLEQLEKSQEL